MRLLSLFFPQTELDLFSLSFTIDFWGFIFFTCILCYFSREFLASSSVTSILFSPPNRHFSISPMATSRRKEADDTLPAYEMMSGDPLASTRPRRRSSLHPPTFSPQPPVQSPSQHPRTSPSEHGPSIKYQPLAEEMLTELQHLEQRLSQSGLYQQPHRQQRYTPPCPSSTISTPVRRHVAPDFSTSHRILHSRTTRRPRSINIFLQVGLNRTPRSINIFLQTGLKPHLSYISCRHTRLRTSLSSQGKKARAPTSTTGCEILST